MGLHAEGVAKLPWPSAAFTSNRSSAKSLRSQAGGMRTSRRYLRAQRTSSQRQAPLKGASTVWSVKTVKEKNVALPNYKRIGRRHRSSL